MTTAGVWLAIFTQSTLAARLLLSTRLEFSQERRQYVADVNDF